MSKSLYITSAALLASLAGNLWLGLQLHETSLRQPLAPIATTLPDIQPLPTTTAPHAERPKGVASEPVAPAFQQEAAPAVVTAAAEQPPPPAPSPQAILAQSEVRPYNEESAAYQRLANLLNHDLRLQANRKTLNGLLSQWFVTDPTAAATWINEQADTTAYDGAILNIAIHLAGEKDFEGALGWAESIHNPTTRAQSLAEVYALAHRAGIITDSALQTTGLSEVTIRNIRTGDYWD